MELTKYSFLQNYKNRVRLFIDLLILVVSGVFLLWVGDLLKNHALLPLFIKQVPQQIIVVTFFLFLVLLFVLAKDFLKWFIDLHRGNCVYEFKSHDWPNEWIFNGKTETLQKIDQLHVKSSRAGCLLKNYRWKNLRMTFDMKFEKSRTRHMQNIGLVFRAEDLDNYFMLEILQDNDFGNEKITGLKPHVRFRGGWELMDIDEKHLDLSAFKKIILEVEDDIVTFFYDDEPIFKWILPTHVDVNHIEAGFKQKENSDQKDLLGKEVTEGVQEIPFRLAYGMVGFRAHPVQGAIIRGLKVEPL